MSELSTPSTWVWSFLHIKMKVKEGNLMSKYKRESSHRFHHISRMELGLPARIKNPTISRICDTDIKDRDWIWTLNPRKRERAMATTRLMVTMKVCVSTNPPPSKLPKKRTEGWVMRLAEQWTPLLLDNLLGLVKLGKKRDCRVGFKEKDEREERSCREMRGRVAIDWRRAQKHMNLWRRNKVYRIYSLMGL